VQGERPQSWIRLGKEPNNTGSGGEANHDDGSGAVAVVMQERSSPRCFCGVRGVDCGSKQKAMELCGGAREACGGEMRCSVDAAQTRPRVLHSEGETGKGSGVGDGVGVSRGGRVLVFDAGRMGWSQGASSDREANESPMT
jgi:hypothetical protein